MLYLAGHYSMCVEMELDLVGCSCTLWTRWGAHHFFKTGIKNNDQMSEDYNLGFPSIFTSTLNDVWVDFYYNIFSIVLLFHAYFGYLKFDFCGFWYQVIPLIIIE